MALPLPPGFGATVQAARNRVTTASRARDVMGASSSSFGHDATGPGSERRQDKGPVNGTSVLGTTRRPLPAPRTTADNQRVTGVSPRTDRWSRGMGPPPTLVDPHAFHASCENVAVDGVAIAEQV